MKIITLFIFSIFVSSLVSVEFIREDLDFTLKDSLFIISGNYYFENSSEKLENVSLVYPFPQDNYMGKVTSHSAFNIKDSKNVLVDWNQNHGVIKFEAQAKSISVIRISYSQEILENKAKYILMTTHTWGSKFEEANYSLITAKDMKISKFWDLPDDLHVNNSTIVYIWKRNQFLPKSDFIIEFKN